MMTNDDMKRIKDKEQQDLVKRASELDNSLSISLETNDKYQRENKDLKDQIKEAGKINQLHQELSEKLKTRAREAEGETSIIKAVGTNSPEIRDAQARIKELEDQVEMLTKQKEYMQKKCREAGGAILDLELQVQTFKKDIDRLSEENDNLRIMMKNND